MQSKSWHEMILVTVQEDFLKTTSVFWRETALSAESATHVSKPVEICCVPWSSQSVFLQNQALVKAVPRTTARSNSRSSSTIWTTRIMPSTHCLSSHRQTPTTATYKIIQIVFKMWWSFWKLSHMCRMLHNIFLRGHMWRLMTNSLLGTLTRKLSIPVM